MYRGVCKRFKGENLQLTMTALGVIESAHLSSFMHLVYFSLEFIIAILACIIKANWLHVLTLVSIFVFFFCRFCK